MVEPLTLLDWKRRIFELYGEIRGAADPEAAWRRWREVRDELFASHPQSPIPEAERNGFGGLDYFAHDPRARVVAEVQAVEPESREVTTSGDGAFSFTRFAVAAFGLYDEPQSLELYWLEGYGGGVFLSFTDATSGDSTYAAGRYLLDTVKGSDLGSVGDLLVLDFNFAYNPSCSYDPRWICPLAPPSNRLAVPVQAGERTA